MKNEKLKLKIKKLPPKPGLYFFKNSRGEIIYIGKSVNLQHRVKSYFQTRNLGLHTQKMVAKIKDLAFQVMGSDFEALLWEAKLINQKQPYYNLRSKDDKSYLMIGVSQEPWPRIFSCRRKEVPGWYFGPFPSGGEVRRVLKMIRSIFGFRSCKRLPKKPCLYFQLKLCPGCCFGADKKTYQKVIKKILRILNGDLKGLLRQLTKEMELASKHLAYEQASKLNKQITALKYVVLNWQSLDEESLSLNIFRDQQELISKQLQRIFPKLKTLTRIEAYDVSNLAGRQATGSLVVMENLSFNKDQYRRFKVKIGQAPDDVGMIREIISRRLRHQEWPLPDLMLVDGGKGQVQAAFSALREHHLEKRINLLGLAKKEEILIKPTYKNQLIIGFEEIKLAKDYVLRRLFQHLRDEAHRFAKKYHLQLRKKRLRL